MDYSKNSTGNLSVLSFLFVAVVFIFIWSPSLPNVFSSIQINNPCFPSYMTTAMDAPKDDLEKALGEASMGNKTVIIAIVNKAYVEGRQKTMLDLFIDSFWPLINHLLLVTVDQKLYMSDKFIEMMWIRTLFLADVLKRGYSFIFTDTDIMWLRNPFTRLDQDEEDDLRISCDRLNGNQWSEANPINTGFYYVRSNNKAIALFDSWYAKRHNSTGMKEQDVLDDMKRRGEFKRLGLKVRYLNTLYFITIVHANCCRTINAKVADLTLVLQDWKKFKATNQKAASFNWSGHNACAHSW
uniref:Nucleotide-diphospho-sugar transferase domain-containing protein n=1 Tax=Nelumbo nucifera TaxID=4432 RepID=A0A822XV95_NELNU|nr:TPA_asm: hypothetical protein HUJ06_024188 [Nelumbo nucifera]